jgi:hypothetical protein
VPLVLAVLGPLALGALACRTKQPVLYPNAQLERVGKRAAERDVAECMALADDWVGTASAAEKAAMGTVVGGGSGAAIGAAGGAVRGHAGRGAATGAAAGATAGLIRGLFSARDPDPAYRGYVVTCLQERGYRTIGWK